MKVEFIEDAEGVNEGCGQSIWETQKGKKHESHLCLGSGGFFGDCALVPVSS